MLTFLRDIGKHLFINQMIDEAVQQHLDREIAGFRSLRFLRPVAGL
ncbi:hypothetical protein ACLB1S_16225 [Escherichia coli]